VAIVACETEADVVLLAMTICPYVSRSCGVHCAAPSGASRSLEGDRRRHLCLANISALLYLDIRSLEHSHLAGVITLA
jgi:hypothetical protein